MRATILVLPHRGIKFVELIREGQWHMDHIYVRILNLDCNIHQSSNYLPTSRFPFPVLGNKST